MFTSIVALSDVVDTSGARVLVDRVTRQIADFYRTARIERQTVEISSVIPLSRYVVEARLARAHDLLAIHERSSILPYEPVLAAAGSSVRIIFPPVVEVHGGADVLMDGTHRLLAARARGVAVVSLVRVFPADPPPLPCTPTEWQSIRVDAEQKEIVEILPDYRPEYFRHATTLFNSERFVFGSFDQASRFCRQEIEAARSAPDALPLRSTTGRR